MSVPDDFIRDPGPYLVEASAGTGKTTWMVRTAVRLLLQDGAVPPVDRPERLLAVTFTRAATAELKERLRRGLQRVQQIRDGGTPKADEAWMRAMLEAGGEKMSEAPRCHPGVHRPAGRDDHPRLLQRGARRVRLGVRRPHRPEVHRG